MKPALKLLRRTTCPHCWSSFAPEEVLWVSAHEDLRGDPRLGADDFLRFLPSRFNLDGTAVDARGFPCHRLACPKCHLSIPKVFFELEPVFVSILGSPGCGKSFFLGAVTWELRRLLPLSFGLAFTDADTEANALVKHYENSLFLNPDPENYTPMQNLIRKTEEAGADLYSTVRFGNQLVRYPRPFLFTIQPTKPHPLTDSEPPAGRVMCLYDNAGESFEVGKDSTANQSTRHLAYSSMHLFLFDPLQDVRFRQVVKQRIPAARNLPEGASYRQEGVLQETASRVRRVLGMSQNARHNKPLIVVCTKFDVWGSLLGDHFSPDPWKPGVPTMTVDQDTIQGCSVILRALLLRLCPETVTAAESFSESVTYVPVSALGCVPAVAGGGRGAIRPRDIKPRGVAVPLMFGLSRALPQLVSGHRGAPAAKPAAHRQAPAAPAIPPRT